MQFALPGDNKLRKGKLLIEDQYLYLRSPFKSFSIPLWSIRDAKKEKNDTLTIKHTDITSAKESNPQVLSTEISTNAKALNELERQLILQLNTDKFNIYFTHAEKGGVLSLEKNVELERGVLKISDAALWIIGENNMRRIDWNEITNVEQKKRGRYKGTEYSAISIDYFDKKSINNEIISSIIITRSNIMNSLRKHVLELLSYYKVAEKLSDVENQILISIYAGAFNFNSPSISTSIADAFEISEEELKEHMNHLSEVEMIKGLSKEGSPKLTKKGIKYVVELSKEGTFGG